MEKKFITEEDHEFNVFHLLEEYADANPDFDSSFLDSVGKDFHRRGFITQDQLKILNEIYQEVMGIVSQM